MKSTCTNPKKWLMQVEAKWCMDEPWMNQILKPHYDLGLENNYIVYQSDWWQVLHQNEKKILEF